MLITSHSLANLSKQSQKGEMTTFVEVRDVEEVIIRSDSLIVGVVVQMHMTVEQLLSLFTVLRHGDISSH